MMYHSQFQISNFALPLTPPMTPTSQSSEHDTACLSLKWKQSGMDQPLYKDTELNANDVEQGLTLLSWACHSHSEFYLKKYLQAYDLDINKTSGPANETALHIAASAGFIVGVKLLAQHPDVRINAVNKYGQTALHLAAQTNHPRCIRALLAHGARPDLSDGRGQLALHVAVNRRHMHCVTELLQDPELLTVPSQIDKRDAIEMAVVVGDAPILKQLLSTAHERQQRRRQKSLLHLAVFYNRIECLQLLVDFGYDVNEDIVESPLYLAVQQRKFDLVRLLRTAGANPCLADGTNPSLGYAIHHGLLEMIPMLVTLSTSTEFIEQAIFLADHLSRSQRNQTIDLIIRTLKAIAAKT